jgi:hypothetical protein
MEHLDEQEMLIQYSEMAAFDFNSEEFQKVKNDYVECRNFISNIAFNVNQFVSKFKPARGY